MTRIVSTTDEFRSTPETSWLEHGTEKLRRGISRHGLTGYAAILGKAVDDRPELLGALKKLSEHEQRKQQQRHGGMYIAVESFTARYDGAATRILKDRTRVAAGHELLRLHPAAFRRDDTPIAAARSATIERTISAPVAAQHFTSRRRPWHLDVRSTPAIRERTRKQMRMHYAERIDTPPEKRRVVRLSRRAKQQILAEIALHGRDLECGGALPGQPISRHKPILLEWSTAVEGPRTATSMIVGRGQADGFHPSWGPIVGLWHSHPVAGVKSLSRADVDVAVELMLRNASDHLSSEYVSIIATPKHDTGLEWEFTAYRFRPADPYESDCRYTYDLATIEEE
jgi:hypothetical protein